MVLEFSGSEKESSSCKCTRFEISNEEIRPGESAQVLLAWEPKSMFRDQYFRQEARIETNDKDQQWMVLTIQGQLRPSIKIQPSTDVVFSKVVQNKGATAKLWLYSFRDTPLAVNDFKLSNAETASYFEIKTKPLAKNQLDEEFATSGILIEIKIKSEMPLGQFHQSLENPAQLRRRCPCRNPHRR